MISTIRSALARCPVRALQLAALALALATAGCDKVGCFEWTEIEGACPSQEEAPAYFGSNLCGGEVESVDSEPEYVSQFCGSLLAWRMRSKETLGAGASRFGGGPKGEGS